MQNTVIGTFNSLMSADNALVELKAEGVNSQDISIVSSETEELKRMQSRDTETQVVDGAASGSITGAGLGALGGLLLSAGILAIPGAGALLVAGPLAVALGLTGTAAATVSGAITGGVTGGLLGGLIGLGLSNADAESYAARVNAGETILAVRTNDAEMVKNIFHTNGGTEVRVIESTNT